MTELKTASTLDAELCQRIAEDPLAALSAITTLRSVVHDREREAVFGALETHSWREVGEALGVSKQAAFQRFGRDWVQVAHSTLPPSLLRRTIKDRLTG